MIINAVQATTIFKQRYNQQAAPFIVFEGINGSGKTTLIKIFQEQLDQAGVPSQTSHEPGATQLGLKLRQLLLEANGSSVQISPLAELLLFAADRAQHVTQIIQPALENEIVILSDRYHYSTQSFQGYGRGLPLDTINSINKVATSDLEPNLVILLDLDAEIGLQRTQKRQAENKQTNKNYNDVDAFEAELLEFHKRVRSGYLKIAQTSPTPFLILDANLPIQELKQIILPITEALIYPFQMKKS